MRKFSVLFIIAAAFSTSSVFAFGDMSSKACDTIAKACTDAGYNRDESATKKFWHDCMRPLLLNKTAEGVTVDAATVNQCRSDKIAEMKKEMAELSKVPAKK